MPKQVFIDKASIRYPRTFEDAKKFDGAIVSKFWPDYNNWFDAKCTDIETTFIDPDGNEVPLPDGEFSALLRYHAQLGEDSDCEDVEFINIFGPSDDIRVKSLPPAAQEFIIPQSTEVSKPPPVSKRPAQKRKPQHPIEEFIIDDDEDDAGLSYTHNYTQSPPPVQIKRQRTTATTTQKVIIPKDWTSFTFPRDCEQGQAGQIYKVELINFMCHHHFEMILHPHVNIITGPNGSGKSAIVQAFQCCVGVKASGTGRFKNMKQFIKHGTDSCTIKVTFWNTGPDAYQPDVLGPMFTIVRQIKSAGSNSFTVYDARGGKYSTNKRDVETIIDDLAINAANPAVVMTQDLARSFAGEGSETAKFNVFADATQFDSIDENLRGSAELINQMRDGLDRNLQKISKEDAKLDAKRVKLESLKEIERWRNDMEKFSCCCVWQIVYDTEEAITKLKRVLEEDGAMTLGTCKDRLQECRDEIAHLGSRLHEQQMRLQQVIPQAESLKAEVNTVKAQLKTSKQQQKKVVAEIRELEESIDTKITEKKVLEDSIAEADAEQADYIKATQAHMEEHTAEVERTKRLAEETNEAFAVAQAARQEASKALAAKKREIADSKENEKRLNGRVKELQGQISTLEGSSSNKVARFGGRPMIELVRLVAANKQFKQPPIGPIGSLLSLKDDKWANAIEAALGRSFNNWIVDNSADLKLLLELANKAKLPRPSCIVYSYRNAKYVLPQGGLQQGGMPTILSVLDFPSDPLKSKVLFNTLVDSSHIEKTLLAETDAVAKQKLRDHSLWQDYAVSEIWSTTGTVVRRRGRTELVIPWQGRINARIAHNDKAILDAAHADLVQVQAEHHDAAVARQRLETEEKSLALALKAAEEELKSKKAATIESQAMVMDLSTQQPAGRWLEDERLLQGDGVAGQMLALNDEILSAKGELAQKEQELARIKEQIESQERRFKEIKTRPAAVLSEQESIAEEIQRISQDLEDKQEQKKEAEDTVKEVEEHLRSTATQLAEQQNLLPIYLPQARAICRREFEETVRAQLMSKFRDEGTSDEDLEAMFKTKNLSSKVEQIRRMIEHREEQAGDTLDELKAEVARLELKSKTMHKNQERGEKMQESYSKSYKERKRKTREMQKTVADNVNRRFGHYMTRRGHRGSVNVDFRSKTLSIGVGIDKSKETKDLKALSGGERSIATIAFILALGMEAISPPFQLLDEFDIFTDAINRRFSLQYLMDFARLYSDRQLILLTPQDMGAVREAKKHMLELQPLPELPRDFMNMVAMKPPRAS